MAGAITGNDRQVIVLAASVEPDRQAKPVGQRELVIHRVARVDRIVLLGRMARHDRAAVGRNGQPDIGRPRIHPAFQP